METALGYFTNIVPCPILFNIKSEIDKTIELSGDVSASVFYNSMKHCYSGIISQTAWPLSPCGNANIQQILYLCTAHYSSIE